MSNPDFVPPSAMEAIKAVEKNAGPEQINALTRELNGLSESQMFALSNQVNEQWIKQNNAHPGLPSLSLTPESGGVYQYDHDHPVQVHAGVPGGFPPAGGSPDGSGAVRGSGASPDGSGAGRSSGASPDDTHFVVSIDKPGAQADVSTEIYHREFKTVAGVTQDIKFAPPTVAGSKD